MVGIITKYIRPWETQHWARFQLISFTSYKTFSIGTLQKILLDTLLMPNGTVKNSSTVTLREVFGSIEIKILPWFSIHRWKQQKFCFLRTSATFIYRLANCIFHLWTFFLFFLTFFMKTLRSFLELKAKALAQKQSLLRST